LGFEIRCGPLRAARRIAMNAGLRYVYTGNVHDPAGQSTHCHACGAVLIGRDWYDITAWHLAEDGRCVACESMKILRVLADVWLPDFKFGPCVYRKPYPYCLAERIA
jgi:hypothetical protein